LTTIREIAELVGAPVPPATFEISRVSSIEAATPVALVFATDTATLEAALNSFAGAILTKSALLSPTEAGKRAAALDLADPRLLPVSDPRYSFALAARFLKSREQTQFKADNVQSVPSVTVHPSAVIGDGVRLGPGTSIGPPTVLGD